MAFDPQPVLTGDLVCLPPLRAEDFGALYAIASDPRVWERHPSKERTQEAVFRAWFDQALACQGALVALDRAQDSVIGTSRYQVRGGDEVEIGWTFLARTRWGGPWNAQIKQLMLAHAFAVSPVVFTVHEANARSQRAVQRLGAVRTGAEADSHGRGRNIVFCLTAVFVLVVGSVVACGRTQWICVNGWSRPLMAG